MQGGYGQPQTPPMFQTQNNQYGNMGGHGKQPAMGTNVTNGFTTGPIMDPRLSRPTNGSNAVIENGNNGSEWRKCSCTCNNTFFVMKFELVLCIIVVFYVFYKKIFGL